MSSVLINDFTPLNSYISDIKPTKIIILCDENTHEYCLPKLIPNMETSCPIEFIEIEAGEEMKTIETAVQLWEILTEYEADRKSLLINLGGGVITDMGSFVASTYKRGIHFVNMPTSLLAMCDASIGGKTGIDHLCFKNIIGTFALPEKNFIYPPFLESLPFEELRSGFAEMLKHGLIADKKHWEELSNIQEIKASEIIPYIEKSVKIKENIVNIDFKEENIRKVLNFGHTIGHSLESLFLSNNQTIPHGEAVAAGMIAETYLSYLQGLIDKNVANLIISKINTYFPKLDINFSDEQILSVMKNDKKNTDRKINFTLLNGIGSSLYNEQCTEENIIKSINFYRDM